MVIRIMEDKKKRNSYFDVAYSSFLLTPVIDLCIVVVCLQKFGQTFSFE